MKDEPLSAEQETENELNARYQIAMHAVQSGIALHMNYDRQFTTPKHLCVGNMSAMVTHEGIADLLIAKGVFTKLEYIQAVAEAAEREKERWTQTVREDMQAGDDQVINLG